MYELSILIPCYNDAAILPQTIEALNQVVGHHSLNVETLIVDDESSDRTVDVAKAFIRQYPALHVRVLAHQRRYRGFGSLIRYGLAHAQGTYVALVSADGIDPVDLLPEFLKHLRKGAHLVQCSRYIREEDVRTVSRRYRLFQTLYRAGVWLLLGQRISDTTNGFRAFRRDYVQALGIASNRFNACPEITFKVLLSGGEIAYVPGRENTTAFRGTSKFQLRAEIFGYARVLLSAALHKRGIPWF